LILNLIERWIRLFAGIGMLAALAVIFLGIWRGASLPKGRGTPHAGTMLRGAVYVIIGILFFGACALLWKPLPLNLPEILRVVALIVGVPVYALGLTLVLWGRSALGQLYSVSSSLAAQLFAEHKLIVHGPYAYVRHPMYLGAELFSLGGLFIYRTWTMVFLSIAFLGLVFRARREEEVLAAEFSPQWEAYCQEVPAWLPRFRRRGREKLAG
jgi:protein-S-isoprenylcysteine O-methyltransferase Ste14